MVRFGRQFNVLIVLSFAIVLGAALAFLKPSPQSGSGELRAQGPVLALGATPAQPGTQAKSASPKAAVQAASDPGKTHDGTPKQPKMPAFVELANGIYEAETPRYVAQLSADGLRYKPKLPNGVAGELSVSLQSVKRGAFVLFDREAGQKDGDKDAAVEKGASGLSYWRSPTFEEDYEPRGDGVEQAFVLESKPGGDGNLEFTCALQLKGLVPVPRRAARNGGILFAGRDGKIAARYGQVMVRDAANNGFPVEPMLDATASLITFAVPKAWLDQALYPVVIDPLVGSDFLVSPNTGTSVGPPTVCAGGGVNYLVVWDDFSAGPNTPQLLGAIVGSGGAVTTPFPVSNIVGLPIPFRFQRIEAAFDGANWLVVWSDLRGPGIYGSIVGSSGAVLNGSDFLIGATDGRVTEDPLVSFDGTNFVVAWDATPPGQSGGSQIYVTRVTSTGAIAQSQVIKNVISPSNQALEYLASQRPGGDTMIVYKEALETPAQHRVVRIANDGAIRDTTGGISLFKENIDEQGFGRPIGVVFNNNEWQILSSYNQLGDSSIFLHHLSLEGVVTPPAGVFAEMGVGPTSLQVGGQLIDSFAPAFPGSSEWLFLRNEKVNGNVYHLLGKRVTFAGQDLDPIPFQIDTSTQGIIRNGMAAQAGSAFLVAWLDGRNAPTQPGDANNVAAALVDASAASLTDTALVAVAGASPISGEAPLSVAFDATGSKGTYDTLSWNFGDGTAASTLISPSHIYKNNGTYVAQLKLTKGAYSVFDTVVITVGTGGPAGTSTLIGLPKDNTPPIVTGLFINTAAVKLDFKNLNNDKVTITGVFDVTSVPSPITGRIVSITIGGISFTFNLDAKGQFKSDAGATPAMSFAIDPLKGVFSFQLGLANLRSELAAIGMINQTITPSVFVTLPLTIGIDTLSASASVSATYRSTLNVAGTANYSFLGAGSEISGSFLITTFACNENADKSHNFTIKGRLVKPGVYKPAPIGSFDIFVGSYENTQAQVGLIFNKGGTLTYKATAVKSGLKMFSIDLNSGIFNVQLLRVPSDLSIGGTGMPLAKSGTNITNVDLNLSFSFDLDNNEKLTAGRYIYIGRKNADTKSWKLR